MYIKLATSIVAIYTVTTNAGGSSTETEGIKRLSTDHLDQVMEFFDPKTLNDFSQVDRSIRERVTPEVIQRQSDLDVPFTSFTFARGLQILGLQDNAEQFVRDFPWHNFNNPAEKWEQRKRIPFPKQMCPGNRCRGIYGGRPALVIQLTPFEASEMTRWRQSRTYKDVAEDTYYLAVRFCEGKDPFGNQNVDMGIVARSVREPWRFGEFAYTIVSWEKEAVLRRVYRESKEHDIPGNALDLRKCIKRF